MLILKLFAKMIMSDRDDDVIDLSCNNYKSDSSDSNEIKCNYLSLDKKKYRLECVTGYTGPNCGPELVAISEQ
jgi:hypothetical protein